VISSGVESKRAGRKFVDRARSMGSKTWFRSGVTRCRYCHSFWRDFVRPASAVCGKRFATEESLLTPETQLLMCF
jgi:hypothetical protein